MTISINPFMISQIYFRQELFVRILTYLFLLVIIALGITFALINPGAVTVHYYVGQKTLPFSLLLVATFGAGCLLGFLICGVAFLKLKLKTYQLKQRLSVAEKEVQNLRVIPLQDRH